MKVLGTRVTAFVVLCTALASAQPAPTDAPSAPPAAEDPRTEKARTLYKRGVESVKREQWSEALASFEESSELRPHATTTFNIAACERALGHYTRAREILDKALEQAAKEPGTLAPSLETEAKGLKQEIEALLVRVQMTLDPPNAAILVDGRPLAPGRRDKALLAGVETPGPGRVPPSSSFEVVMNPGTHVITLSRKGYSDAVVRKTYGPGTRQNLALRIEKLPATLKISSNIEGALVRVGDSDVGPVPSEVLRPAGSYRVSVSKKGFDPYESSVTLNAGQQSELVAKLNPESRPITKEWWFWAGSIAVVATGVIVTYALTRPEPDPPPYDGGSTGWVAQPLRF